MKRLLLIAAVASTPALADSWAMPNQAGGEIVVTDRACPGYKNLSEAYNYGGTGKYMSGCWAIIDGMIHIMWDDGSRFTYPMDAFYQKTQTRKGQKL